MANAKHNNNGFVGMTVQVLDQNGNAVRRHWFGRLASAQAWLNEQFPHLEENGFSVEIFYDEEPSLI